MIHPPRSERELERRLRGSDRVALRREIVDRLFDGGAAPQVFEVLSAALLQVGVRGEERRLERVVADSRRSAAARWTALSLIFNLDQALADRILLGLAPEDRLPLVLQPAAESIRAVVAEAREASALADAFMATHPDVRGEAFAYLEDVRRHAGTPAVLAYREVLRRDSLSDVRDLALEAIVGEGGPEAAAELAALRDAAPSAGARQAFQRALLRLGTRAIEAAPALAPPPGRAYLGHCDGQGAFIVLGCFENADGSTTIADLCVRADADVRDGFAEPALDDDAVSELLVKMEESGVGFLVPVPLTEAAAIVREGVQRTRRGGLTIAEGVRPALMFFERVPVLSSPGAAPGPAANDGPGAARGTVTSKEALALLALPPYACWFFDRGDLGGAGARFPPPAPAPRGARRRKTKTSAPDVSPRDAWIEHALAGLAASEVAPRLAAMLDHMARWHGLAGEQILAAICATSAREARESFQTCAVVRAMLDRSLDVLAKQGEKTGRVGDPDTREHIRLAFFPDVDTPEGRDLAGLDFTEAAIEALETALEVLPGSRRPRADELMRGAFAIGTLFARYVIARRKAKPEALVEQMSRALGEVTRLDAEERKMAIGSALPALAIFVEEVCGACPVACLKRPGADVADAFFATEHPAFT